MVKRRSLAGMIDSEKPDSVVVQSLKKRPGGLFRTVVHDN
jgi:hypothetical protein